MTETAVLCAFLFGCRENLDKWRNLKVVEFMLYASFVFIKICGLRRPSLTMAWRSFLIFQILFSLREKRIQLLSYWLSMNFLVTGNGIRLWTILKLDELILVQHATPLICFVFILKWGDVFHILYVVSTCIWNWEADGEACGHIRELSRNSVICRFGIVHLNIFHSLFFLLKEIEKTICVCIYVSSWFVMLF